MPTRGQREDDDRQRRGRGLEMPEDTNQVEENATQGASAEPERTFTQAEVNKLMGELRAKERAKHADYDELKAKAAKLDEIEEASKSELQKAVEERDKIKAKLDKLEADKAHADAVAKAATEHGVDADLLMRMSGDPDENAAYLKEQMGLRKYPSVPDFGETKSFSAKNTAQQFADAIDFL